MDERTGHAIERSAAALALENERLQRALRARLSEEAALRRVATLVARQHAPEEVFTVVTEEVARHLDADAANSPRSIGTVARVHLRGVDGAPTIQQIDLETQGDAPGLDEERFRELSETAKAACAVSRALRGVERIGVSATLAS